MTILNRAGTAAWAWLLLLLVSPASAENWPQWRGPENNGISGETGLPTTWGPEENVAWRTPLPGPAGSTPVIWGDRIFLTSAKGQELVLLCLDTGGKLLWERKLDEGDQTVRGDEGNYASPSPSTDGQHVWAYMGTGMLGCYDMAGNEVWRFSMQERYGRFNIQFGMTSSPVLDGEHLYVQCLHTDAALVVCLNKLTGEEVWQQTRESDAYAECEHSYASPLVYREGDTELLITHGCDYVVAHRLSDGQEIWRCGGMNPRGNYNPTLRFVASPVANEGLVVVPTAKNGPVLGLLPRSEGDITDNASAQAWRRDDNTPDVPSPIIHEGLVYLCRENGILLCLDAKTGEQYYMQRTHSDRHRASPVCADGKIYLTARDGTVTVVKAGREFEVLASNSLGEAMSSSPAISGGRIYLRTYDALWAIE